MRDNNIVLSINGALQWPRLCHVDAAESVRQGELIGLAAITAPTLTNDGAHSCRTGRNSQ